AGREGRAPRVELQRPGPGLRGQLAARGECQGDERAPRTQVRERRAGEELEPGVGLVLEPQRRQKSDD
ncbi:hypothetical protein WMY93_033532, partial [Mugilogobius chulae]